MGSPGSLFYSGLGTIVNRCETKEFNDKFYPKLANLTPTELDNLQAGSSVQLWYSENHYEQSSRYVAGIISKQECLNQINSNTDAEGQASLDNTDGGFQIPGRVTVFMGKDSGGIYRISDENGPNENLYDPVRSNSEFLIASQWFHALKIPKK